MVLMTRRLVVFAVVAACGTDNPGEPVKGTIAVTYGTEMPAMKVGAAIQDEQTPANMFVMIGTGGVSCATTFKSVIPTGTFVSFSVDKTAPWPHPSAFVEVFKSTGNQLHLSGSTGDVTIDAIADRVTGSVTMMTTDNMVGMIAASGTFDVKRCF